MPASYSDEPPRLGIVGLLNQVPDPAFRVAETGEGAQALRVGEQHGRAFDGLGLLKVRLAAGRFRAVEVTFAWVPSQNGLLPDWPQRQSAYCGWAGYFFPSA